MAMMMMMMMMMMLMLMLITSLFLHSTAAALGSLLHSHLFLLLPPRKIHTQLLLPSKPPYPPPHSDSSSLRNILLRPNHQLRSHQAIKLLAAQRTQLHRRLAQRQPLLMRVLGDAARGVVTKDRKSVV